MANAKQFEFNIIGRGVLVDSSAGVTQDNLSFVVDTLQLNGVSCVNLDAAQVVALSDALATIAASVKAIAASA